MSARAGQPGSPPEHVKDRREDVGFVQHTLPILQVLHEFLQRKDSVASNLLTDAVSTRAVEWAEQSGEWVKVGTHSPKLMPQIGARKAVRVRQIAEARDGGFEVCGRWGLTG